MSKSLTKNARWIIFWARYTDKDSDIYVPHEVAFNIGRHSYDTPTLAALNECLDFSEDRVLASQVYEIDVSVYPYAKQHKEATRLAEQYFSKRRIVT